MGGDGQDHGAFRIAARTCLIQTKAAGPFTGTVVD